jgi:hypothetical protein
MYVRRQHPEAMSWFRAKVTASSWGSTVLSLKMHLNDVRESALMLCTNALRGEVHPKDNLYMCGHYCFGHRGVAIEFDTENTAVAAINHHQTTSGARLEEQTVWAKIEYLRNFPPISPADVFEFMKQENELERRRISTRGDTALDSIIVGWA